MSEVINKQTHKEQITWKMLSKILDKKGLTVSDVAKAVGIKTSTLHDWVTGKSRPTDQGQYCALAEYLNVTYQYLTFGTENDQNLAQMELKKKEYEDTLNKLGIEQQMDFFKSNEDVVRGLEIALAIIEKDIQRLSVLTEMDNRDCG